MSDSRPGVCFTLRMEELQDLLEHAEVLVERVRNDGNSDDFQMCFTALRDRVSMLKDRAAAFRIWDAVRGLQNASYVLRTNPADLELRKHVVLPAVEQIVQAVKFEIHRKNL